ncbi:MAG: HDOD domain-containing protein [Leptothrix sp. (in: b-proteobacteria)]
MPATHDVLNPITPRDLGQPTPVVTAAPVAREAVASLATPSDPQLAALVSTIGIPPQPELLSRLHDELSRPEPRLDMLVQLASYDVAVAAALLKVANQRLPGVPRGAGTLRGAFERLGAQRCMAILGALVLRKVLPVRGPNLERFWDVAQRRSMAMAWLARSHGLIEPDVAHTLGLFCDVGIAVLQQQAQVPSYRVTLAEANLGHRPFTEVERGRHHTDHAQIGAELARSWGLSAEIVEAVALHHDYPRVFGGQTAERVRVLVALVLSADHIIQRQTGLNRHREWQRGGRQALHALGISDAVFEDWTDEVHAQMALAF